MALFPIKKNFAFLASVLILAVLLGASAALFDSTSRALAQEGESMTNISQPDLIISAVKTDVVQIGNVSWPKNESGGPGSASTYTWRAVFRVKNIGTAIAPNSTVHFLGPISKYSPTMQLAPGVYQTYFLQGNITIVNSPYFPPITVTIKADSFNQVAESNETNNVLQTTLKLSPPGGFFG